MILFKKPDTVGIFASSLCLVHCIATPFLFLIQAHSSTMHTMTSKLWVSLDYFFLIFSLLAIYWSTKASSKYWIKGIFWTLWLAMSFIILNEKIEFLNIPEYAIYFPSLGLIALHFYNRKFCICQRDSCSVNSLNK